MGKPYHKHSCGLNPPESFVDHERHLRDVVNDVPGVRFVEIAYGFGPSAELVLDVDHGFEANLVRLLEGLRRDNEAHFLTIVDVDEPGLTAGERDALAHPVGEKAGAAS